MAKIEIKLSGRIPKYFFGVLKDKYKEEAKEALQYCNDIKTENDFLNLIFALTLDGINDPKEDLFNAISKEDLEKLENFNELVMSFIESGEGHYQMIDCLFDSPCLTKYGSYYGISFFETDAQISIIENDRALVEETSLEDFISDAETIWAEEAEEGTEEHKDLLRINQFRSETSFGFDPNDEYYSWRKNEAGATFLSSQLLYSELDEFTNDNPIDQQATIFFDDITDWTFYIDTEGEDFDMKDLTFVSYPGAEEFISDNIVFSHLFYKNEVIVPDENCIRDKGISLMYGKSRGLARLDFFING